MFESNIIYTVFTVICIAINVRVVYVILNGMFGRNTEPCVELEKREPKREPTHGYYLRSCASK